MGRTEHGTKNAHAKSAHKILPNKRTTVMKRTIYTTETMRWKLHDDTWILEIYDDNRECWDFQKSANYSEHQLLHKYAQGIHTEMKYAAWLLTVIAATIVSLGILAS